VSKPRRFESVTLPPLRTLDEFDIKPRRSRFDGPPGYLLEPGAYWDVLDQAAARARGDKAPSPLRFKGRHADFSDFEDITALRKRLGLRPLVKS
jgi:hypothetical protein